jgi:hypothetical protein
MRPPNQAAFRRAFFIPTASFYLLGGFVIPTEVEESLTDRFS